MLIAVCDCVWCAVCGVRCAAARHSDSCSVRCAVCGVRCAVCGCPAFEFVQCARRCAAVRQCTRQCAATQQYGSVR
jgi:hypothetical protein